MGSFCTGAFRGARGSSGTSCIGPVSPEHLSLALFCTGEFGILDTSTGGASARLPLHARRCAPGARGAQLFSTAPRREPPTAKLFLESPRIVPRAVAQDECVARHACTARNTTLGERGSRRDAACGLMLPALQEPRPPHSPSRARPHPSE